MKNDDLQGYIQAEDLLQKGLTADPATDEIMRYGYRFSANGKLNSLKT